MTKYAIAATLAAIIALPVAADYRNLVKGNPDSGVGETGGELVGVRPGLGTSFDVFHGLADGNPNLFQARERTGDAGSRPDIYQGLGANPDLSY